MIFKYDSLINRKVKIIINRFTITFDQFKVSLLYKSINSFKSINLSYWPQHFEW